MSKILTTIIVSTVSCCSCYAIDLTEALERAYDHSPDFKAAQQDFLITIETFPSALSEFIPHISAQTSVSNSKTTSMSQYGQGSSKNGTTGQSLSLTQPIFNGGSSMLALKAAQSYFKAARGQFYEQEQKIILESIQTYLVYYQNKKNLELANKDIEFYQQALDATETKFRLGESTKSELAYAKSYLATAKVARSNASTAMEKSKADFKSTFNIEPDDTVNFPQFPEKLADNLDQFLQKALSHNYSLDAASNAVVAKRTASKASVVKNLLPQAQLQGSVSRNFYDHESRRLQQLNGRVFSTSLSLTLPILARGGKEYSEIREANKNYRKSIYQRDITSNDIVVNATALWENVSTALEKMQAADEAVEAGKIAVDAKRQEFNVGNASLIDVLDFETKYSKDQREKYNTYVSTYIAAYQAKALIGDLTAQRLKLKLKYFSPEKEFKKIKFKIVGF